MKLRSIFLSCVATATTAVVALGQISLTTPTYTQNFDTLATSATNVTNHSWSNNVTLPGWFLYNSLGASPATYASGSGDNNSGAFYSLGVASSTERAFGGIASGGAYFGSPTAGTLAGYIAVAFTNSTGSTLTTVSLSYDGEQWRNGGNASAQTMKLEYGFGSNFSSVALWTEAPSSFHFTSPVATATAAAVNGNVAGLVSGLGGDISVVWAVGETLWLRWIENNDIGNDHGLAIDNFTLTAVPEPSTYAAIFGALALVGVIVRRRMTRA